MFYDRFVQLCKARNVKPTPFIVSLGLSSSNSAQWKKGSTPRPQVIQKIADEFEISQMYFYENEDPSPVVYCFECGMQYNSILDSEAEEHANRHIAWCNAVEKFGFCWEVRYREEKKADARAVASDSRLSAEDRMTAQVVVFKSLFSRSLTQYNFKLDHPEFESYVAMILWQGKGKHEIPEDLYDLLVAKFGTKEGIRAGTLYRKENPLINSNADKGISVLDLLTENELLLVYQYAQRLIDARPKQ